MFLIIISGLVLVAGILLHDRYEGVGGLLAITGGTVLALALICWPLFYLITQGEIQEYYAVKSTVAQSRETKTMKYFASLEKVKP